MKVFHSLIIYLYDSVIVVLVIVLLLVLVLVIVLLFFYLFSFLNQRMNTADPKLFTEDNMLHHHYRFISSVIFSLPHRIICIPMKVTN